MEIRSAEDGTVLVIGVSGRLDSVTSDTLDKEVRTQVEAGRTRLVFDLTALDYISSAGLRVFLLAARALRGKGSLALAAPQPKVQQVFDIAGMGSMVTIYGSTTEAVGALKA
jgi:anti-sigma B factor antagonist